MKKETIRCERCGEVLNPKMVKWLELSNTDGNYYKKIPQGHESQGGFPFGKTCEIKQINETKNQLQIK
jgi:hypothetical protein